MLVPNLPDDKGCNLQEGTAAIPHRLREGAWYSLLPEFKSVDLFEYPPDLVGQVKVTSPSLRPIFYGTYSSVYRGKLLGNYEPVTIAVKVLKSVKETTLHSLRRIARRECRTWAGATPTAGGLAASLASYDSVLEAQRLFHNSSQPPDSLFPQEGACAGSLQKDTSSPVFEPPVRDDGTPFPFYVETNQGSLGARIQHHGGSLTSALEPRSHISVTGSAVPPMNPAVPVLRARWVEDSIQERRMLPMYPYFNNSDQDILQHLSPEDRDVAELLKANVGNSGEGVFDQLHTRLPHNTTDVWRTLYQNSQVAIQTALARIASPNQEQLNRLILPIFPPPVVPVDQRPARGVDIRDQGHAVRVPSEDLDGVMGENEYSDGMEQLDSDDRSDSESTAQPPSTSASSFVDQHPMALDFIGDSGEDGGEEDYTEEDSDTEYADSGWPLSPSETPPPRRGNQRPRNVPPTVGGVKFKLSDLNAMIRFLTELDREPTPADWEVFRNLTPENQVRSTNTWRTSFSKDPEIFLADVLRLRAQDPADAIESLANIGDLMTIEQRINLDATIGVKYEHSGNAILIHGDLKQASVRDDDTQANDNDELPQDQSDTYQSRLKLKQTIGEYVEQGIPMHIPQVVVAGYQLFEGTTEMLLQRNAATCTRCPTGHAQLCSLPAGHSRGDADLPSAVPLLAATPVALKMAWDSVKKEKFGEKTSHGPRFFVITRMGGCGKTQIITKLMHGLEDQFAKILFVDGSCGPVLGIETTVASDEPLKWNIKSFSKIFSPESNDLDSGSPNRTSPPGGPDPADLSGQVVIPDYRMPKFGRASLVYRGVRQDKQVAVKILKARMCVGKTTNWERKMRREIASATSMWAALKHPNILPLSGYSDDFGDFGAFISPWCEQGTAQQYLAGRNVNYQKRARLALDVCEGLRYLHRASIIHGDIKPMNILIDDGVARLCDFGLSWLVHQQELGDLTATTVYDGPERYMAPEIFASVDVQRVIPTYEGDIYALGCIMLEFVEGVYPFQRLSSNREVIDAILSRLPPALRCESTHTSPITMDPLWTLLDTCWGEPSSRPSIAAVVECVAGLVNSEGVKDLSPIVTNGPSYRNTDRMGRQAGNLEEGGLLYRSSACSDIAGAGRPWRGWKWIRRKKGKPMAPIHVGASET